MKHFSKIKLPDGKFYSLESVEKYEPTEGEIQDFSLVLDDEKVSQYITKDALERYDHRDSESLARDILINSKVRWEQGKELRFLIRDENQKIVGIVGVTLESSSKGELWYFKSSKSARCMSEALKNALTFLVQEGLTELVATYELDNQRSKDILFALGFKESGPGNVFLDRPSLLKFGQERMRK